MDYSQEPKGINSTLVGGDNTLYSGQQYESYAPRAQNNIIQEGSSIYSPQGYGQNYGQVYGTGEPIYAQKVGGAPVYAGQQQTFLTQQGGYQGYAGGLVQGQNQGQTQVIYGEKPVAEDIGVESRILYIPFEHTYEEDMFVDTYEEITVPKEIVEFEEVVRVKKEPIEKVIMDYYAVETQKDYIKREIKEKVVLDKKIEKKGYRLQYIPVEVQIVHYPQRPGTGEIISSKVFEERAQIVSHQPVSSSQIGGQYVVDQAGRQVAGQGGKYVASGQTAYPTGGQVYPTGGQQYIAGGQYGAEGQGGQYIVDQAGHYVAAQGSKYPTGQVSQTPYPSGSQGAQYPAQTSYFTGGQGQYVTNGQTTYKTPVGPSSTTAPTYSYYQQGQTTTYQPASSTYVQGTGASKTAERVSQNYTPTYYENQ